MIFLFPAPYPYELGVLLVLLVFLVIAASAFRRKPSVIFVVACANLVGNLAVTQQPGGVAHPLLWYAYYQVINVLVLALALGLWRIDISVRER